MAIITRESSVQRSVTVKVNATNVGARMGSNQAKRQTPAFLSHLRHLSQRFRTGYQPGTRRFDLWVDDSTANRAGRPGSIAGVLVRRSPAMSAGLAVRFGWPKATGVSCPMADDWCLGENDSKRRMSAGSMLPGRMAVMPAKWPAFCRAPWASTRGKIVR